MCKKVQLNIDIPLSTYCPLPYLNNPKYLQQVTLYQILTHTAGFPAANLKVGERLTLESYPDTAFVYSGESF